MLRTARQHLPLLLVLLLMLMAAPAQAQATCYDFVTQQDCIQHTDCHTCAWVTGLGECVPNADKCTPTDDGDPCTLDECRHPGGCGNYAMDCDDGDACTLDSCSGGVCQYTPVDCNDGNACTDDVCNASTGVCESTNNAAACNDGDACTENDACSGGVCSGMPITCDDGNACTNDSCAGGSCVFTNDNSNTCDDGDACTDNDACVNGACTGTAKVCDDSDVCTNDFCVRSTGACLFSDIMCQGGRTCIPDSGCPSPPPPTSTSSGPSPVTSIFLAAGGFLLITGVLAVGLVRRQRGLREESEARRITATSMLTKSDYKKRMTVETTFSKEDRAAGASGSRGNTGKWSLSASTVDSQGFASGVTLDPPSAGKRSRGRSRSPRGRRSAGTRSTGVSPRT